MKARDKFNEIFDAENDNKKPLRVTYNKVEKQWISKYGFDAPYKNFEAFINARNYHYKKKKKQKV